MKNIYEVSALSDAIAEACVAKEHKGQAVQSVHYTCTCGWKSSTHYGQKARKKAASEFVQHKKQAAKEAGA